MSADRLCDCRALDEPGLVRLAQKVAGVLAAGDVLALEGDLGTGKTTFARALVRRLLDDDTADVPSPTFTLTQIYQPPRGPDLWHVDLYRIDDADEVQALALDEAREDNILLIEWPDRAPAHLLDGALWVRLSHDGDGRRVEVASLSSTWRTKLQGLWPLAGDGL